MATIYIEETENGFERNIDVFFKGPGDDAPRYTLATFPVNTAFTRRMAATVACSYSEQTDMPISFEGLSISLEEHCKKVERDLGLAVTYRMGLEKKMKKTFAAY